MTHVDTRGGCPLSYASGVLAGTHSWLDRHTLAGDAALAVVLLGFSLLTLAGEESDAGVAGIVFSVLLTAPLVFRRRAPVAVFAAVMLACGGQLLFVDEVLAANFAALMVLYTLVAYAPRRLAAIGLGVTLAGTVPFALHFEDLSAAGAGLTWLVATVHLLLAAVLGDRMHARLQQHEGLRERARTLAAERDQQATIAAAAERARITRELHDVIAHSLSVVIAQADGGRYAAEQDPRAATAALHTIASTAREAQAEMRHALGVLGGRSDAPMHPQPGVGELAALIARTREAGLEVELAEEGVPRALAPAAGVTVYRVAQEALTNVLKHAGPGATASVVVSWQPDEVTVVVRDDGRGAVAADDGRGRGLTGMRERVEPRGGTLSAGPHPEGGFEVRAAIPAAAPRATGARRS